MMGHREKLICGTEFDMLTRARRYHHREAGGPASAKAAFNRRVRRNSRIKAKQAAWIEPADLDGVDIPYSLDEIAAYEFGDDVAFFLCGL